MECESERLQFSTAVDASVTERAKKRLEKRMKKKKQSEVEVGHVHVGLELGQCLYTPH